MARRLAVDQEQENGQHKEDGGRWKSGMRVIRHSLMCWSNINDKIHNKLPIFAVNKLSVGKSFICLI